MLQFLIQYSILYSSTVVYIVLYFYSTVRYCIYASTTVCKGSIYPRLSPLDPFHRPPALPRPMRGVPSALYFRPEKSP